MSEEPEWRRCLVTRLRERNRKETDSFKEIILQNNRLLDSVAQLKADNLKLSIENERVRTSVATGNGKDSSGAQLAIAALEKKLLTQQEELTELHKRKGENAQLIVDLNIKVEKQKKAISEKDQLLADQQAANNTLRVEVQMLKSSLEELKKLNTTIKDEHTALHLAFTAQSEKLRSVQDENQSLLQRIMVYKSKDADKLNEENESFIRKRSDRLKRELEDAVREPSGDYTNASHRNSISPSQLAEEDAFYLSENGAAGAFGDYHSGDDMPSELGGGGNGGGNGARKASGHIGGITSYMNEGSNPTHIFMKFDAHENESHAVRWSPIERTLATGGSDRKVKLWDVSKGSPDAKAMLGGSSAGINSVDFDSTGHYIIGTSNDYGARVWTVADSRLRHTLTGHSGKVMAAKYLQEPIKVVTGSYDRTLKIWDLRSIACIETKFAGSSCNDLVTTDSLGSTIISAHLDKKIRFWDIRTEKQADDVLMTNKITSLDLSKDCNNLICTVRDDTIKMLDLRKNQVTATFSNENFKLSCDWARASLNATGTKIACGSSDGLIYIWNIFGQLETTLKGHSTPVNAVSWSSNVNAIASVGKSKRCIIYTDS